MWIVCCISQPGSGSNIQIITIRIRGLKITIHNPDPQHWLNCLCIILRTVFNVYQIKVNSLPSPTFEIHQPPPPPAY